MTTAAIEHKHRFPCNPPGGSFLNPGPCECGKTYPQDEADRALTEASALVAAAYPLPAGDYLTGVQDGWHAVARATAEQTRQWFGRTVTFAVCVRVCRLADKYGAYDPDAPPVAYGRCPECAWMVA